MYSSKPDFTIRPLELTQQCDDKETKTYTDKVSLPQKRAALLL